MSHDITKIDRCVFCKLVTDVRSDPEDGLLYCTDTESCLYRFEIARRHWRNTIKPMPGLTSRATIQSNRPRVKK